MPSIIRNTREVMVAMRDEKNDILRNVKGRIKHRDRHNTSTDGKQAESCDHVSDPRICLGKKIVTL